nr:ribonuclease H-like domain-containing protein [Tanacetum cinerariifolium]
EYGRKTMPVENPTENALIAQDGIVGYYWSYQAKEEHPTNCALMELTSSGSSSSSESENQENFKSISDKEYYAVPPPYTGNYIPPKLDLMFIDKQVKSESVDVVSNVASSDVKTVESKHESVDVKNKGVPISNAFKRGHSQVIRPYNKYSTYKKIIFNKMVNTVRVKDTTARERALVTEGVQGKGVIDSGYSRHVIGNKCYLSDYEDYDGRFVSFGDGKGRISGKGIKREFSVVRTPQQKDVAKRKNRTLIKAARTMLVDFKLPTTFWVEAINTACYVLNRALVIKPHNKTPYELIRGRPPLIDFMKLFGCPVTILNTRGSLSKFDEKANEGFFGRYSMISKAMRVFNKRTRIVEETLNIRFLENAPNVKGNGPDWLFDIDSLTISMNYEPVVVGKQTNSIAGTEDNIVAGPKDSTVDAKKKATEVDKSRVLDNGGQDDQVTRSEFEGLLQQERKTKDINITNSFNIILSPVNTHGLSFANTASPSHINAAGTPASTNAFEEHPFE